MSCAEKLLSFIGPVPTGLVFCAPYLAGSPAFAQMCCGTMYVPSMIGSRYAGEVVPEPILVSVRVLLEHVEREGNIVRAECLAVRPLDALTNRECQRQTIGAP